MLSDCQAVLFAQTPAQNRSLIRLANRVGFGAIRRVFGDEPGPVAAGTTGVRFFLVHHRLSDKAKASIVIHLRSSDDEAVRYAPIILISDDGPIDVLLRYVQLGFDDVITLPEKCPILVGRLQQQLDSNVSYIETKSYLGPDRHRLELLPKESGASADTKIVRLTIRRSVAHGIQVVGRQLFSLPGTKQAVLVGW